MKKTKLLILLAMVLGLTSCTFITFDSEYAPVTPESETDTESDSDVESEAGSESESDSESEPGSESEEDPWTPPVVPTENETFNGYYRLNNNKLYYDQFTASAPHEGKANMLVILLQFDPGSNNYSYRADPFTNSDITKINNYFFGEKTSTPNSWNSLKTYFEHTSMGALNISGLVTDPYVLPTEKSVKYFVEQSIDPYGELHSVFNDAVAWAKETYDESWTLFDQNDDGHIDSLHFITNLSYAATQVGEDNPFWPHKWEILTDYKETGTISSPVANIYEQTSLGHFTSAETIIHEQSHVFGIQDYYDYAYSGVDYIGCFDMQSHNVGDWNSYSKFSVGWSRPYVVDGTQTETTITINPAALTNECIVIPADHDTFNGSAFDEYFLIELFTADGHNEEYWSEYIYGSKDYGIRLYHVDSRLWSYYFQREVTNLSEAISLFNRGDYVDVGCSNSNPYNSYHPQAPAAWSNYKLLTLIQAGGVDTFGEASESLTVVSNDDLFYAGEEFIFEDYDHFLTKDNSAMSTMDNGETFPYKITFDSVSKTSATVTITKI